MLPKRRCANSDSSLRLDIHLLGDGGPGVDLGADKCPDRVRRAGAFRRKAQGSQPLLGLRVLDEDVYLVVQPRYDQLRRAGGRNDGQPAVDGFGTPTHSANVDLEWLAVRKISDVNATGLMVNTEAVMVPGVGPDWKYQIWYPTTIGPLR